MNDDVALWGGGVKSLRIKNSSYVRLEAIIIKPITTIIITHKNTYIIDK